MMSYSHFVRVEDSNSSASNNPILFSLNAAPENSTSLHIPDSYRESKADCARAYSSNFPQYLRRGVIARLPQAVKSVG